MTKFVLPSIGLALLWGVAFAAQATAGECGVATCEAGCANAGCQACGCNGGCCNNGCEACKCCPHCGCKLEPVCQITCGTKKTAEHRYCCGCKEICVPSPTCLGRGNPCDPCNNCCQDNCDCHCRIHEVHKLMVFSVTKETPVRQCTVQWVCPRCSQSGGQPAAAPASPAPAPVAPAPTINRLPPPPKTTSAPTAPEDIRMAGF